MGDHARLAELPDELRAEPLRLFDGPRLTVPFELPEMTLNPLSMRIVNAVVLAIQAYAPAIGHFEGFFYPLDRLLHWNRGYGRRGFNPVPVRDPVQRR